MPIERHVSLYDRALMWAARRLYRPIWSLFYKTKPMEVTLTKKQAAAAQIDCAIARLHEDDWASAVTLAGAAESCIPNDNRAIFGTILDESVMEARKRLEELGAADEKTLNEARKFIVANLNKERDWLKHSGPHHPNEIDLEWITVFLIILRAVSKYLIVYNDETEEMRYFVQPLGQKFYAHLDSLRCKDS